MLTACLDSLAELADEIVVYDTGSTDGTAALARAHGALVVEGYWDDDFGAARNRALDECNGYWILHLDADERLVGNVAALRTRLRTLTSEGLAFRVVNAVGVDEQTNMHVSLPRVFPRKLCHWKGALHETVVWRDNRCETLPVHIVQDVEILHEGYRPERVASKHKLERNLRAAERDFKEATSADRQRAAINYARSARAATDYEAAKTAAYASLAGSDSILSAQALALLLELPHQCLTDSEALHLLEELERHPAGEGFLALARLGQAGRRRDWPAMYLQIEQLPSNSHTSDFLLVTPQFVEPFTFLAAVGLGRYDDAWALLRSQLDEGRFSLSCDLLHLALRSVPEQERPHLTPHQSRLLARSLASAVPEAALTVFELLWAADRANLTLLIAACYAASRADISSAAVWSVRARAAGFPASLCPLLRVARDRRTPAPLRLLAAGLAWDAYEDEGALSLLDEVSALVEDEDCDDALRLLQENAPSAARLLAKT